MQLLTHIFFARDAVVVLTAAAVAEEVVDVEEEVAAAAEEVVAVVVSNPYLTFLNADLYTDICDVKAADLRISYIPGLYVIDGSVLLGGRL